MKKYQEIFWNSKEHEKICLASIEIYRQPVTLQYENVNNEILKDSHFHNALENSEWEWKVK